MTDHRRLKTDRKKLEKAKVALDRARQALCPGGDPFWGPIVAHMAPALDVLERRLMDEEREVEGGQI